MRSRPTVFTYTILLALALAALSAGLAAATTASAAANAAPSTAPPGEAQALRALKAAEEGKLTAADGAAHDYFGNAVAISGDTAVVGASRDNRWRSTDQGSVYIFTRSGSTWSQQQKLTAADGAVQDDLGGAVAISRGAVLVGAPLHDVGANSSQGSVYVFRIATPAKPRG